jgi:hypothetical protein
MKFIRRWYAQRCCMHHDVHTLTSWVEMLGALDGKKYYECKNCRRLWISPRVKGVKSEPRHHRS